MALNLKNKLTCSVIASAFVFSGCSITPTPLSILEIQEDSKTNLETLETMSQIIKKPITLDEAVEKAMNNNLEKKMGMMNTIIAHQKIDAVTYEALPELAAKAGYSARNEYAASASASFTDGIPTLSNPPSYSVSQDKKNVTAGASFSWNVLDFGLSYVRASQQGDKYLIAKENERKAKYNLKQEVRSAYYRAVAADELLSKLEPIMMKTRQALEDSRNINTLKLDSPLKTLTYQRELLEVVRTLNSLEESLMQSKIELAKLMGLKPGTQFSLAEKIQSHYTLPVLPMSVNELEKVALENRPELQEARYQIRISDQELTAIKLKLLPGINLNAGLSYDDNKYLLNNQWMSYGANVSWNLFSVFSINQNMKIAKTSLELAKLQKLALSMGVISQVHLSMIEFQQAKKEYQVSEEYAKIATDIYQIIDSQTSLNVNGKLSLIKEELNYLISNLKLSSSYAKVQNAYGKLIVSVGNPEVFQHQKIDEAVKPVKENTVVQISQLPVIAASAQTLSAPLDDTNTTPAQDSTSVNTQENSKKSTPVEELKTVLPISSEPEQSAPVAIKDDRSTVETQPQATSKTYAEARDYVYIRKSIDMKSDVVRRLRKGDVVEVIGTESGWLKTAEGFIYKKYFNIYFK